MATSQRRGDPIPGFDCATGRAISHSRAEWDRLIQHLTSVRRQGFTQIFDGPLLVYEIYDERQ